MTARRRNAALPRCVDCIAEGVTSTRETPHGGPRSPLCVTHFRARKRRRSGDTHAAYIQKTYGITTEQYWALYEHQDGRCYICRRATGKTKRLAVDHDHSCCPETPACGRCVRGLLCGTCNKDVVGHLRDDVEAFLRGAEYLRNPPALTILYGA